MNKDPRPPAPGIAKSILMLAFQFPPFAQSTGRLRTLSFARHLPALGWKPIVITGRESAYPEIDTDSIAAISSETTVIRAFGFDAARALSIGGVYPRFVCTPDRWNSWAIGAVVAGLRAIRRFRPQVLWSTFPIPSATVAAFALQRLSRLPWILDLRDPMVYESWPDNKWDRRVYRRIENAAVGAARAVVVTTPGACRLYRERYATLAPERFLVVENGIDDPVAEVSQGTGLQPPTGGPITLLHSGLMESPDRDPTSFFFALRLLADRNQLPARPLQVVLRASGRDVEIGAAARAARVEHLVRLMPRVQHRDAMREMAESAGLLLFQGKECNRQIPAKAYEYLSTGRPIIGLLDPHGDTHALVAKGWGVPYCADMIVPEHIANMLRRFFQDYEAGRTSTPPPTLLENYSRRNSARRLAQLLDEIVAGGN